MIEKTRRGSTAVNRPVRTHAAFAYYWSVSVGIAQLPSKELMTHRYQLMEVRRARARLNERLAYSFTEGPLKPRDRTRYVMALVEVENFLQKTGVPAHLRAPIAEIYTALSDLEHGICAEFLKPSPIFNRSQEPSDVWQARAYLAIAVDVLVASGLSRQKAADHVSKQSRAITEILNKNSKSAASALATWHEKLIQGKIKNHAAVSTFDGRAETLELTYGLIGTRNPLAAAADVVSFVERLWRQKPRS